MLTSKQREVLNLRDQEGLTWREIAKKTGRDPRALHHSYKAAHKKIAKKRAGMDAGVMQVMDNLGMSDLAGLADGWVHREDPETGEWASVRFVARRDGSTAEVDLKAIMADAVKKVFKRDLAKPARPKPKGENLLVIDIADLHIGKLCVKSETGVTYDRQEAIRRGIEGCRKLLEDGQKHGFTHILFVLGNDVIHIDRPGGTTTAGTPQDTDGTWPVMWSDAFAFYVACIDMCREYAPVSLIYCPSNHDWTAGFYLAQAIGAWYRNCPEVHASEYNLSIRHRKYFVFGGNLLGVTHADGAKEADLPQLMVDEAVAFLATARRRYWYLHHFHHKIRKKGRASERRQVEKDLIGLTVIQDHAGIMETDAPEIEYVRSPSPPDGWHDRNGYVNRQAVEAFLHHPHDGQCGRFTAWF